MKSSKKPLNISKSTGIPVIGEDGKIKATMFPHEDVQRVESLDVNEVALVKHPANGRSFLQIKFNKNKQDKQDKQEEETADDVQPMSDNFTELHTSQDGETPHWHPVIVNTDGNGVAGIPNVGEMHEHDIVNMQVQTTWLGDDDKHTHRIMTGKRKLTESQIKQEDGDDENQEGQKPEDLTIPEFRKSILEQINRLLLEANSATNLPDLKAVVGNAIKRLEPLASAEADNENGDEDKDSKDEDDKQEEEKPEDDNEETEDNDDANDKTPEEAQELLDALDIAQEAVDILHPPA